MWLSFIFDNRLKNEPKNACPVNSLRSNNTGRPPALNYGGSSFIYTNNKKTQPNLTFEFILNFRSQDANLYFTL